MHTGVGALFKVCRVVGVKDDMVGGVEEIFKGPTAGVGCATSPKGVKVS